MTNNENVQLGYIVTKYMKVNPHLGKVNMLTYDTVTPSLINYNIMMSNTKKVYTQKNTKMGSPINNINPVKI